MAASESEVSEWVNGETKQAINIRTDKSFNRIFATQSLTHMNTRPRRTNEEQQQQRRENEQKKSINDNKNDSAERRRFLFRCFDTKKKKKKSEKWSKVSQ